MSTNDQPPSSDRQLSDELRGALSSSLPESAPRESDALSDDQIDRILARSHAPTVVPFPSRATDLPRRPWHTTTAYTAIATTALAAVITATLVILNYSSPPTPPSPAIAPPFTIAPTAPPAPFEKIAVTTAPDEKRRIPLPDGSLLFVRENSSVTLTQERYIELTKGEIYLHVAKHPQGKPFNVVTPDRRVTALGTRFAVAVEPLGTSVLVTQGKVEATGAPALLVAGQRLSATDASITPAPRYDQGLAWTRELIAAAGPAILPSGDYAGGALVAKNPDGPDHRFDLRKLHVDVYIEDGFARTTIDQTYFNHLDRRLEGTFYFPLPADASISRLAMYVGENLMEGGMVERNHARQTFEAIKHKMLDPALLEWMDGTTFRMRVFPLEGRQEKRIVVSYTQSLESLADTTTYRFPVGHSQENIGLWSLKIRAKDAASKNWHSPSHTLDHTTDSADLVLTASENNHTPHNDVVLHLESEHPTTSIHIATLDNWTYLMLDHSPELPQPEPSTPRRDWIVLLETSGDRSPVLARTAIEALRTIAENIDHSDTITLVTADTTTTASAPTPAPAADLLAAAEHQQLLGALDLEAAFTKIAALADTLDNPVVLHLGSATPVLGERDHATLAALLPVTAPYVGVGIGKSWNRNLMNTAATRSSGIATHIHPDQPVSWAAFQLLSQLNAPRLTGINVTDDRNNTYLNLTNTISQGQSATAITRFPADAELPTTLTFNGQQIPVAGATENAGYLPRTWAKLDIDRLVATGADQNRDRIVTLSKAAFVISPFTSLLVLENDEMYAQYNIDRGRKDHWALYPCPEKIEVIHEPLQNNNQEQPDDTTFAALSTWCPATPSSAPTRLDSLFSALDITNPQPQLNFIWAGQLRYDYGMPVLSKIPRLSSLFSSPATTTWKFDSTPNNLFGAFNSPDLSESDAFFAGSYLLSPNVTSMPLTFTATGGFPIDHFYIDLNMAPEVVEFEGFLNYNYFDFTPRHTSTLSGGRLRTPAGFDQRTTLGTRPPQITVPPSLQWHRLLAHTPAFRPNLADALTIAAAKGKLTGSFKPDRIDPAARTLIDNTRAQIPAAATLTTTTGHPLATFHTITPDSLTFSRTTATGLAEILTLNPESLTYAYPDLALAARRQSSPFHRLALFAQFPFLLPSADDLATNATVEAIDDSTVTVSCGDTLALTLTFSPGSKLTSLTRHIPNETKITFAPDGTIAIDGTPTLVLKPTDPTPAPTTTGLFTLPTPALSNSDDPLHHLAGHIYDDPASIQVHIATGHFAKDERHLGIYSLLFNGAPDYQATYETGDAKISFDPLLDHPDSPLARYIASGHRLAAGDALTPPGPDAAESFITRLSHARYLDWALADETRTTDPESLILQTLDAIDPRSAPALTRIVLAKAHPLIAKLHSETLQRLAATAATLVSLNPSDLRTAALQVEFLAEYASPKELQQTIDTITAAVPDQAAAALLKLNLHNTADSKADLAPAFAALAATDRPGLPPAFWQQAAALAEQHDRTLDAITFHQRAADTYYTAIKDDPSNALPASLFEPLLKAQTAAAKAMAQLQQHPDQAFIDAVVHNADRWRSVERQNPTQPCNAAAECLDALGQHALAWRYRTNDLAHHPREKSSWLTFAHLAAALDRPNTADHAFTTAFSLEETNATTLLQHAQYLLTQNRIAEARTLLTKITTTTWGPDFNNTVQQATFLLAQPPLN